MKTLLLDRTVLVCLASLLLLASSFSNAFVVTPSFSHHHFEHRGVGVDHPALFMAGGFGGGSSKTKKKKEPKLKPKAQWDRYGALKKETMFRVAVRVMDSDDWLEVGRVKSKDNDNTEIAVARQRALIVDHARRLFPLAVKTKDRVEWGYLPEDSSDSNWIVVDKSIVDSAPEAIEKQIGFEGRPDPASGFYCYYSEGRLVTSDEVSPLSKKLQ